VEKVDFLKSGFIIMIEQIFDFIGGFGPLMMFFVSIKLLWSKSNLLAYYSYGFFLDIILNLILKGIFKQPRPSEDPELFKLAVKSGNRFRFPNGFPHDIFGMPSGHASSVFYSSIFIYLSLKNTKISILYILFSLLVVSHRIYFNHHTFIQIIVGSIVGILFGSFMYYMGTQKIMGKISEKNDDFAYDF
jgi:membrane-associated phospholipid phosphatase